jgi:hypothetical protein
MQHVRHVDGHQRCALALPLSSWSWATFRRRVRSPVQLAQLAVPRSEARSGRPGKSLAMLKQGD